MATLTRDYDERECGCPHCHPERFPSGPRLHEAHFADRFGDLKHRAVWMLEPRLDGVVLSALEVIPGEPGVIVAPHGERSRDRPTPRHLHACPCGSGELCQIARYGRVTVSGRVAR